MQLSNLSIRTLRCLLWPSAMQCFRAAASPCLCMPGTIIHISKSSCRIITLHYEIWGYYQSTSKAHAEVLLSFTVLHNDWHPDQVDLQIMKLSCRTPTSSVVLCFCTSLRAHACLQLSSLSVGTFRCQLWSPAMRRFRAAALPFPCMPGTMLSISGSSCPHHHAAP